MEKVEAGSGPANASRYGIYGYNKISIESDAFAFGKSSRHSRERPTILGRLGETATERNSKLKVAPGAGA